MKTQDTGRHVTEVLSDFRPVIDRGNLVSSAGHSGCGGMFRLLTLFAGLTQATTDVITPEERDENAPDPDRRRCLGSSIIVTVRLRRQSSRHQTGSCDDRRGHARGLEQMIDEGADTVVTGFNAEPHGSDNRLLPSPVLSGGKTHEQIVSRDDALSESRSPRDPHPASTRSPA